MWICWRRTFSNWLANISINHLLLFTSNRVNELNSLWNRDWKPCINVNCSHGQPCVMINRIQIRLFLFSFCDNNFNSVSINENDGLMLGSIRGWGRRYDRSIWKHLGGRVFGEIEDSRGQVDLEAFLMLKSNSWGESDVEAFDDHG